MTILTNAYHGTRIQIRANVGDRVSEETYQRVRYALCTYRDERRRKTCLGRCHHDGTFQCRYGIGIDGHLIVIDRGVNYEKE